MGKDAAGMKPVFIEDDRLRPRDDSGMDGTHKRWNKSGEWNQGGEAVGDGLPGPAGDTEKGIKVSGDYGETLPPKDEEDEADEREAGKESGRRGRY